MDAAAVSIAGGALSGPGVDFLKHTPRQRTGQTAVSKFNSKHTRICFCGNRGGVERHPPRASIDSQAR